MTTLLVRGLDGEGPGDIVGAFVGAFVGETPASPDDIGEIDLDSGRRPSRSIRASPSRPTPSPPRSRRGTTPR